MFDEEDNDFMLLVLGVLAAVLLVAIPGVIRSEFSAPDLGSSSSTDDEAADDDLFDRTRSALDGAGFAAAGLTIAGTTAVLDGEVETQTDSDDAEAAAAAVEGVTDVENNLTIAEVLPEPEPEPEPEPAPAPTDPSAVLINYEGDESGITGVTLTGLVANEVAKTQLVDQVVASVGDPALVDDQLEISDAVTMDGATVTTTGELPAAAADDARSAYDDFEATGFAVTDEIAEAAEPEPEPPSVTLEASLNELVGLEPIQFDVGAATIRAESQPTLDQAAEVLLGAPDGNVTVEGHTDNDGAVDLNQTLSEDRAASVVAALVERGVDAGRLTPEGFGESDPVGDNGTPEGRQANRRIEFVVS